MRHPALRYGVALIAVVVAIAARYALLPVIGPHPKYLTVSACGIDRRPARRPQRRNRHRSTGRSGGRGLFRSYPVSDT